MIQWIRLAIALAVVTLGPGVALAQISFPSTGYYAALGDSVAAGVGALPATNGYVYRLYQRGAFGQTKATVFANIALPGARSWDLRDHQVPQILCAEPAQRPTVVTITAGANDFFRNDLDVGGIARRVAEAIDLLLNNTSILDPITGEPCRPLTDVTILVSNYYNIPHPDPAVFALLSLLLQGFDQALRFWVAQVDVPDGSRVAIVDLYTPSLGRQGLVKIERRLGFPGPGPFDFDPHPTNLGHQFIAQQFEEAWRALEE